MTVSSFADDWYKSRTVGDGVTLIWEAQIRPDVRCNIWYIRGRDRDLLIDTGFGIKPLRRHIPFLTGRPLLAVGTHTHCDHVGAHHEFECRAIHADEADILTKPTKATTVVEDWYVNDDMFENFCPPWFDPRTYEVRPAPPTEILHHGDVLDLGDRAFEVVHIPGHSPGSIALWEPRTGIFLTGDVVHDGKNGIGQLILYHSNDDAYLESVERIRDLPVDVVHAGHYDSFGRERYVDIIDEYIVRQGKPGCPIEVLTSRGTTED